MPINDPIVAKLRTVAKYVHGHPDALDKADTKAKLVEIAHDIAELRKDVTDAQNRGMTLGLEVDERERRIRFLEDAIERFLDVDRGILDLHEAVNFYQHPPRGATVSAK